MVVLACAIFALVAVELGLVIAAGLMVTSN